MVEQSGVALEVVRKDVVVQVNATLFIKRGNKIRKDGKIR